MKPKTFLMIVTLMIITMYSSAQIIETELYSSKIIVKASVDNLIKMYWMTTAQWETEMKKLTNYKGPYYNPDVEYTASNSTPFFTHSVIKSPNMISIMCLHVDGVSIMENLFNELEPYYTSYENNMQLFTITKNDVKYVVRLTRSTGNDMVILGIPKK